MLPPRRIHARAAGLGLALGLVASGCHHEPPPPKTLKDVMVRIDAADKDLQTRLGDPDEMDALTRDAAKIEELMGHPAFGTFPSTPDFHGDPAAFADLHQAFQALIGKFVANARAGDVDAVAGSYFRLQMSCVSCHAKFRPVKAP